MEIEVRFENGFGKEWFYPMNEDAQFICHYLMHKKCFTREQINAIKERWEIREVYKPGLEDEDGTTTE